MLSTPSQLRWSVQSGAPSGFRDLFEEAITPRPSLENFRSEIRKSQVKGINLLPGFQNTFNDATPLRPSRKRLAKEKHAETGNRLAYEPFLEQHGPDPVSPLSRPRHPNTDVDVKMDNTMGDSYLESSTHIIDVDGDVEMPFGIAEPGGVAEADSDTEEDLFSVKEPDWKGEVLFIHFTFASLCRRAAVDEQITSDALPPPLQYTNNSNALGSSCAPWFGRRPLRDVSCRMYAYPRNNR